MHFMGNDRDKINLFNQISAKSPTTATSGNNEWTEDRSPTF